MVSPLDGTASLARIALLVQKAVQRRGQARSEAATPASAGAASAERLGATLKRRVRELQGTPAERRRLVSRLLVESLLLEGLGHALINDVEFQNLVDDVLDALRSVPQVAADLERVVGQLIGPDDTQSSVRGQDSR
ncbi:hypothetical protein OOT46_23855 [Aquabacterium sp. A7-Y]|uniref:hypothetical protein n=1 Tax=Aquabacterium sp. A7-Y TaxID=1349605 RepID=UPI00223CAC32|nr:hypothetical protein [Aquabacterium sp. A7-Y]MCW7540860.1 hypothetical protein [Aquabacterium sp. A7-Y]